MLLIKTLISQLVFKKITFEVKVLLTSMYLFKPNKNIGTYSC